MSRRRTIDGDIWEDEKIAKLSLLGRLLFIGLITQANDFGKLRGNPLLLKNKIFPYDEKITLTSISKELSKISRLKLIFLYSVNKEQFIKIINWEKHQTLTYRGRDGLPEPKKVILNKPLINPYPILNQPLTAVEKSRVELSRVEKSRVCTVKDLNKINKLKKLKQELIAKKIIQ